MIANWLRLVHISRERNLPGHRNVTTQHLSTSSLDLGKLYLGVRDTGEGQEPV